MIFCFRNSASYEQDSKVQFVIDAVYAFAYALRDMKKVWHGQLIFLYLPYPNPAVLFLL